MQTDNTISLAESVEEILALINARDIVRANWKTDTIENSYLYTVVMSFEIAIKNLALRVQSATR
jgi:hypothetical protein